MKIAFVRPPLAGHRERGSGVYFDNLFKEISKTEAKAKVSLVNLGENLSGFELVHYPYFDPFFLTLPLGKTIPRVVTVHDLIPLKYPGHFPSGIRGALKWLIQRFALLKTDRLITDSQNSKSDIIQLAGIPAGRIKVIPLAADEFFADRRIDST